MTTARSVDCTFPVPGGLPHKRPQSPQPRLDLVPGRVPRVARLLALAHKFERLLGQGTIPDYATIARLGHVSRARITQIMNLLHLAPDIQEHVLFLAKTAHGRDRVQLRQLQAIAGVLDWQQQRLLWSQLCACRWGDVVALPESK
jgi:hypothetical protein